MAFDPNDPDTKAALKAAIDEAVAGLQTKNTELLAKLKKAQKDATIDPADHAALQAELDDVQTKLATALKDAKTAKAEAETAKKALEGEAVFVSKLLVDNGLNDALLKAGVKPEMTKAVKALLSGQVTLKTEGENRIALMGDKPLSDAVIEWAKSDEGKHFVAAPANQGGGATGGKTGADGVKTMARAAFDSLAPDAKMEFTKGGGKLTD
ncbi:MAG: hypothetical protein PHY29_12090 [Syntrophales bacterium]|nr:hypothetical protein [Syntrophales bacterium]